MNSIKKYKISKKNPINPKTNSHYNRLNCVRFEAIVHSFYTRCNAKLVAKYTNCTIKEIWVKWLMSLYLDTAIKKKCLFLVLVWISKLWNNCERTGEPKKQSSIVYFSDSKFDFSFRFNITMLYFPFSCYVVWLVRLGDKSRKLINWLVSIMERP